MSSKHDEWIEFDYDTSAARFKLLVVDDSAFVRNQIKEILNGHSVTVFEAKDGVSALSILEKNSDMNLVLCDVNVSRMDGFSLVERLSQKNSSDKSPIPIVMMTSETTIEKVIEGKKVGASGWVVKPPVPQDIIALIEKYGSR